MRYTLFETSLGFAAVGWSENGIASVELPQPSADVVRARLLRRRPDAVESDAPSEIATVVARIRALMAGEHVDFDDVRLDDIALTDFQRSVYAITRAIPPGRTLTYGDVAKRTGTPRDARAVGQALGANPFPIIVPCHRVVGTDGRMHGFSGPGGTTTKLRLLEIEGYERVPGPSLFDPA